MWESFLSFTVDFSQWDFVGVFSTSLMRCWWLFFVNQPSSGRMDLSRMKELSWEFSADESGFIVENVVVACTGVQAGRLSRLPGLQRLEFISSFRVRMNMKNRFTCSDLILFFFTSIRPSIYLLVYVYSFISSISPSINSFRSSIHLFHHQCLSFIHLFIHVFQPSVRPSIVPSIYVLVHPLIHP